MVDDVSSILFCFGSFFSFYLILLKYGAGAAKKILCLPRLLTRLPESDNNTDHSTVALIYNFLHCILHFPAALYCHAVNFGLDTLFDKLL